MLIFLLPRFIRLCLNLRIYIALIFNYINVSLTYPLNRTVHLNLPSTILILMHKSIFYKNILVQRLMTSSIEWLNGTPRADCAILTFVRSTTAQVRKNKFSILVQWSYFYVILISRLGLLTQQRKMSYALIGNSV